MPERFKVWITKYALSSGIFEAEVEKCSTSDTMVYLIGERFRFNPYVHKRHWHTSEADAIACALKMIVAKRKSIQKSLKKLDDLEKRFMRECK